jgi:short-subunit dehydrogenase
LHDKTPHSILASQCLNECSEISYEEPSMGQMLAIVTGASSGIGFELAKELAKRGYDLVVASAGERLGPAGNEFRSLGVQVTEVQVDLAKGDGPPTLWNQITAVGRPLDIACINAGVGVGGLFQETNLDQELNMVDRRDSGHNART